ncbi:MAG: TatD family hydrolase [candidate division WOR-3 bacterium]|nr:TatD family hydrolase [candidate division WOR-3 bacterium]
MVDTHCHLIDPQFMKDLDAVLKRAREAGVSKIVNAGYDTETSGQAVLMARHYPWLLPAVGIHPNEAADQSIKEMGRIRDLLVNDDVVAIGETGLDYYRDFSPREAQKELFRLHIALAKERHLPILIHTRNSVEDAIAILKLEDYHHGVFHCYSGSYEQAKRIIDIGFYVSFAGVLTFSRRAREVIKQLPIDRLLLETDAPFLSPAGHRGKRNEPGFILETFRVAADILNMLPEKLETILDRNARLLFAFDD